MKRFFSMSDKWMSVIRRFWVPLLAAILAAIFQCYWLAYGGNRTILGNDPLLWSGVAILGFFIALSSKLFIESLPESGSRNGRRILVICIAITALIVSYFRLEAMERVGTSGYLSWLFVIMLAAAGLTVFYAGVIHREREFMHHVVAMVLDILISYLYALVLFLGITLLLLGGDLLFGVVDSSTAVPYVATVCFMPIMAFIFLARIPAPGEKIDLKKGVLFIVDNVFGTILAPILALYVVILYLYIIKIIAFRELPTTSVVNLILWPMALAVLVLFINDHDRERTVTYYFRKYIPVAALPLLILMYYAWFLRVSQYGFTESRYMVFAVGIWITFAMIHFIVEKRERHMILPMTLTLILVVAAFGGPIGAESVAFKSQLKRLNRLLIENHMLKGDKIVPSKQLTEGEKDEIQNIVHYLIASHDVSRIPYLRGGSADEVIEQVFGMTPEVEGEIHSLNLEEDNAFDIASYDRLYYLESYDDGISSVGDVNLARNQGIITVTLPGGEGEVTVDLKDIREKIAILNQQKETLSPEDLAMKGESGLYSYKLVVTKTQFVTTTGSLQVGEGASFYLLLKKN